MKKSNFILAGILILGLIIAISAGIILINIEDSNFQKQNHIVKEKFIIKNNSDKIVITDFEENEPVYSYCDPKSSIKSKYAANIKHEGKHSLYLHCNSKIWATSTISLNDKNNNWENYNYLSLWVYSNDLIQFFDIIIPDSQDESFNYRVLAIQKGWNEIVVPINDFKPKSDWQPEKAILNGSIDFPIKGLTFFSTSTKGNFNLYFDQIEIIKN
jgi:hypothetical protein